MSLVSWIPALLAIVCYVAFAVGVWTVFTRQGPIGAGLRLIQICAPVAAVVQIWAIRVTQGVPPWRQAAGCMLFVLSLTLFLRCALLTRRRKLTLAFSRDTPTFVLTVGPYRWVRHPFYSSYLLAYLAGVVVSGHLAALTVLLGMVGIYTFAASAEERKFEESALKEEYRSYAHRAGRFLPKLGFTHPRFRFFRKGHSSVLKPSDSHSRRENRAGT
jgi:protein-S-isoprenylcysteine O-methyltransferase Ste14